ncbi:YcxB family protein [Streptomyces aquilus]|uniref:YcxB family protein n=1 Tax=Streptomyces aquilus TaxID=2548456 RepID=A0A3Q9C7N0_9ACTN|nr:YcxB family protein [Streptomyces aquilus]AZP22799.1 YcxB family protein [Streptomyces aquilus]
MVMDMGRGAVQDAVELAYEPTSADFRSAVRARFRVGRLGRRRLLAAAMIVVGIALSIPSGMSGQAPLGVLYWCAVLVVVSPRLQARRFTVVAELDGACRTAVTDDGVTIRTAHTSLSLEWAARPLYRETREVFVLFGDDEDASGMVVLPKHGLRDAADVARLREILDRNLTRV